MTRATSHVPGFLTALVAAVVLCGWAIAASDAGRCGGTGGTKRTTLTCPDGQYVMAVRGKAGAFLDSIGIRCGRIGWSGDRGRSGWQTAGGSGGHETRSAQCPDGLVSNYLSFMAGAYIDRVGTMICKGSTSFLDLWRGVTSCNLSCPGDERLYEITVRSGGWIDGISGRCRR